MEDAKKFVKANLCQFIEEEQRRLGLSDHYKVGDYEIGFLKEQGGNLPSPVFYKTMEQFSPRFLSWFANFDQRLREFKKNNEEKAND